MSSASNHESAPADDDIEIVVAAPPWASDALARIGESDRVGVPVRHAVLDPKGPKTAQFPGIQVLWRFHLRPAQLLDVLDRLPDLKWVHSDYVGVDDLPLDVLAARSILLSNGAGVASEPIAEWIVLALLLAAKQLPRFVRQSDAGSWDMGETLRGLTGSVVLLLGLGGIASRAAALLEPFGADVRGWSRRPRQERPRGVTELLHGDAWRKSLADADYVVCTLPLTSETAGLIDDEVFAAMKPGAWLVNVSRGAVIDDDALLRALDDGRLGGAVLDAFAEEPLPPGHRLWRRPDVLVLPHVTWSSPHTFDAFTWRFAAQLRRFAGGLPPADLVDLTAGY